MQYAALVHYRSEDLSQPTVPCVAWLLGPTPHRRASWERTTEWRELSHHCIDSKVVKAALDELVDSLSGLDAEDMPQAFEIIARGMPGGIVLDVDAPSTGYYRPMRDVGRRMEVARALGAAIRTRASASRLAERLDLPAPWLTDRPDPAMGAAPHRLA
ncbi:MAG TPA: hypothetical protein VMB51_16605 [Solirubrobacteraceae bacterium]|nr:hypothetical protein [Solirubrobacteraceae bacterium]